MDNNYRIRARDAGITTPHYFSVGIKRKSKTLSPKEKMERYNQRLASLRVDLELYMAKHNDTMVKLVQKKIAELEKEMKIAVDTSTKIE